MGLSNRLVNGVVVIDIIEKCAGTLVPLEEAENFIHSVLNLYNKTAGKISFDLSSKPFLNSSGLGQLIMAKDKLMDKGIDLVLINPTERVRSLLDMVGIADFFHIVDKETDLS